MGRQSEAIINHFSHPHPLHLTNPHPSQTCSACKQTLNTEPIYTCRTPSCTTYSIHLKCSQLPYRMTHPCHHNHPLCLLPKTQNPNGVFACNACGKNGDGFLYNCKDCNINIHLMCSTLPLYVSHPSHCHQLNLVFLPPYGNNGFSCDVCGVNSGSFCWLYRCVSCGFDAHLSCATSKVQVVNGGGKSIINGPENLFLNQFNNQKNQYLQAVMGGIGGSNKVNNQILQGMMGSGSNPVLQAMMEGSGDRNKVNNQILQGMMDSGSNPVLQAMMEGIGDRNKVNNQILQGMMGSGSNPVLQAMMEGSGGSNNVNNQILQGMMGSGNNPVLQTVMGGIGGSNNVNNQILQGMMGGNPVLQAMMGGSGGGSNPLLQAFMGGGGGGGGGGDLVQSILNGSGGGVGGLDLSSVLGGGGDLGGLMGAGLGGFGF